MEQHGLVMAYTGKGKTTCAGCRLNRNGHCQDRAVYGKDRGDLLTEPGHGLCYEAHLIFAMASGQGAKNRQQIGL